MQDQAIIGFAENMLPLGYTDETDLLRVEF
jgi:hypothetical protein